MLSHRVLIIAAALGGMSCGPAEVDIHFVVDQDGDGYLDTQETAAFTDPRNPADHPYERGWPMDACRHTIEGTGNNLGDIAMDFRLPDRDGDTVRLHDFCGKVILLVSSAFW